MALVHGGFICTYGGTSDTVEWYSLEDASWTEVMTGVKVCDIKPLENTTMLMLFECRGNEVTEMELNTETLEWICYDCMSEVIKEDVHMSYL